MSSDLRKYIHRRSSPVPDHIIKVPKHMVGPVSSEWLAVVNAELDVSVVYGIAFDAWQRNVSS